MEYKGEYKNKCTIIIPTHSSYIDVCENFISVLFINWPDCPYRIVLSVTGENLTIDNIDSIYNGKSASLIDCIKNASNQYLSKTYMIFLGDAFFYNKIDNDVVEKIVDFFIKNKYEYCCLRPKKPLAKLKAVNSMFRYINSKDRYSHSFISFLISDSFLNAEFCSSDICTDRDFEIKYLNIVNELKNYYFKTHVILRQDVFSIIPGIEKGKWNRLVLKKLKKKFPNIQFSSRENISLKWQTMLILREKFTPLLSNNMRRYFKGVFSSNKNCNFDNET